MKGICRYKPCSKPVADVETAVYAIQGYERERDGGGQNHVMHKKRVDGYIWHEQCFEQLMRSKNGGGEQGSLL